MNKLQFSNCRLLVIWILMLPQILFGFVNHAPTVSTNTGMTLLEGGSVVISSANLSFVDADTNSSNLVFTLMMNVSHGTLSVNVFPPSGGNFTMQALSDGNLMYTHNGNEISSDYFDYQLSDGTTSLSGNFSFFITPVNDAPQISANTSMYLSEGANV